MHPIQQSGQDCLSFRGNRTPSGVCLSLSKCRRTEIFSGVGGSFGCVWPCQLWYMYLYGRHIMLRTNHQPLTVLLATAGSGHKPLRIYRWSKRLQPYNFTTLFTPGKENVVADLLSRATPVPRQSLDTSKLSSSYDPDSMKSELVLMLHLPLLATVSLEDLQLESERDPTLTQLRTFI